MLERLQQEDFYKPLHWKWEGGSLRHPLCTTKVLFPVAQPHVLLTILCIAGLPAVGDILGAGFSNGASFWFTPEA